MVIFDKTEADACAPCSRAPSRALPLQALALLNDTQFVEAARVLAQNVERSTPDTADRLAKIFHSLIRRAPDDVELASAARPLHAAERARFQRGARRGGEPISQVGQSPFDPSLDVAETAALAADGERRREWPPEALYEPMRSR